MTLGGRPAPVLRAFWRRPATTMRRVAHDNPGYGVFVLPVLAGLATYPVAGLGLGDDAFDYTGGYVALSLLSFPSIIELLQLFVAAYLISRLAPWFQGRPDTRRLLSALAWSNLPIVLLVPIGLAAVMFAESLGMSRASDGLPATVLLPALAVQVAPILWAKYLLVIGCADALALSRARAALCLATAWLLSAVVIGAVVFLAAGAQGALDVMLEGLPEAFLGID